MRCIFCGSGLDPSPDPAVFDDRQRHVFVGTERRLVGSQPYSVIQLLRARFGRRVSKTFIHDHLPGSPSLRAVDAYICRARHALEGTPYRIETVRSRDVLLSRAPEAAEGEEQGLRFG
jgi:DNA-binding response OmpR family regulator